MERLTAKFEDYHNCNANCSDQDSFINKGEKASGCGTCQHFKNIIDKLAAYEDIDPEPAKVAALREENAQIKKAFKELEVQAMRAVGHYESSVKRAALSHKAKDKQLAELKDDLDCTNRNLTSVAKAYDRFCKIDEKKDQRIAVLERALKIISEQPFAAKAYEVDAKTAVNEAKKQAETEIAKEQGEV